MGTGTAVLEVFHAGHRASVEKSAEHPEQYLWIRVDGRLYFLGVYVNGMTRRNVRRMAEELLDRL